jgi:hypothetical protein
MAFLSARLSEANSSAWATDGHSVDLDRVAIFARSSRMLRPYHPSGRTRFTKRTRARESLAEAELEAMGF